MRRGGTCSVRDMSLYRCHPGSPAGAVRDPGDWAKAVRLTWVPDKRCARPPSGGPLARPEAGMTTSGREAQSPFRSNRHFSASTAPDISRQAVLEAITGQALISTP